MSTTGVLLLALVVLVTVALLLTVRHAALEARRVVDRMTAVRDRVVPLTQLLQTQADRASANVTALQETRGADGRPTTYARDISSTRTHR